MPDTPLLDDVPLLCREDPSYVLIASRWGDSVVDEDDVDDDEATELLRLGGVSLTSSACRRDVASAPAVGSFSLAAGTSEVVSSPCSRCDTMLRWNSPCASTHDLNLVGSASASLLSIL